MVPMLWICRRHTRLSLVLAARSAASTSIGVKRAQFASGCEASVAGGRAGGGSRLSIVVVTPGSLGEAKNAGIPQENNLTAQSRFIAVDRSPFAEIPMEVEVMKRLAANLRWRRRTPAAFRFGGLQGGAAMGSMLSASSPA